MILINCFNKQPVLFTRTTRLHYVAVSEPIDPYLGHCSFSVALPTYFVIKNRRDIKQQKQSLQQKAQNTMVIIMVAVAAVGCSIQLIHPHFLGFFFSSSVVFMSLVNKIFTVLGQFFSLLPFFVCVAYSSSYPMGPVQP